MDGLLYQLMHQELIRIQQGRARILEFQSPALAC